MSSFSEQLSPALFVVRPAVTTAKAKGLVCLKDLASVKPLSGRAPGWLVKLKTSPKNVREGWNHLHRLLGTDYVVLPTIVDETGQYRYPTGLLSLRFEDDASEQELQSVAHAYDLEFVGRAKFTKQQALFKPAAGSDVFLPDISGKIRDDEHIESVWFDAESAFSRS